MAYSMNDGVVTRETGKETGDRRYTVYLTWGADCDVEEVDVDARNEREARILGSEYATEDMLEGWSIVRVLERGPGLYL